MKQKVVIKISMNNDKSRKKALKTIVCCSGVESIALQGKDKDQVEVIGEGIDAVNITNLLRKNVGHSEIVSVSTVEEKKDGGGGGGGKKGGKKDESKPAAHEFINPSLNFSSYPYSYTMMQPQHYYEVPNSDPCSIM